MPLILDGKKLAQTMQAEIAAEVAQLVEKTGVRPGLAAVLVGENPASQVYVRNKRKARKQKKKLNELDMYVYEKSQSARIDWQG